MVNYNRLKWFASCWPWCPGSAEKLVPSSRKSEVAKSVPKPRNKLAMKLQPLWLKSSFKKAPFLGTKLYPTLHTKSNAWVWERDVHGAHMHTKGSTEWAGEETWITQGVRAKQGFVFKYEGCCTWPSLSLRKSSPTQTSPKAPNSSTQKSQPSCRNNSPHVPAPTWISCLRVLLNVSKWRQGKNHGQQVLSKTLYGRSA